MTVSELIENLKAYPPTMRVVVEGYEAGYADLMLESFEVTGIKLNQLNHWCYGRHEHASRYDMADEEALVLSREAGSGE